MGFFGSGMRRRDRTQAVRPGAHGAVLLARTEVELRRPYGQGGSSPSVEKKVVNTLPA
jgi:hypothetical protein